MLVKDFFKFAKKQFKIEMKIMERKGEEYTRNDADKLKNFKVLAENSGLKPIQVLYVYLGKHLLSIDNYIKEGVEVSDEPISGRIHDARNYLLLLQALIAEEKSEHDNL